MIANMRPPGQWQWSSELVRISDPTGKRILLVLPSSQTWTVSTTPALSELDEWVKGAREDDARLQPLLEELIRADLLTPQDEPARQYAQSAKPPEKPEPRRDWPSVLLRVSRPCNLSCPYCSSPTDESAKTDFMPLATAARAAEMLSQWRPVWITFTGGEPLTHPQLLELMDIVTPAVAGAGLASNGTLIDTPELAAELARRLDTAVISIDGHTAEIHDRFRGKGNFERSIRAIRLLREAGGVQVGIRSVAHPELNKNAMKELSGELGVAFQVNGLMPVGRGEQFHEEHRDTLPQTGVTNDVAALLDAHAQDPSPAATLKMLRSLMPFCDGGCDAVRAMLSIDPDGVIFPCSSTGNAEYADKYRLGTLWDKPTLEDILQASPIARDFRLTQEQSPTCQNCFARYMCALKCRVSGFREGNWRERCKLQRDRVSRIIWRFDPKADFATNMNNMYGDLMTDQQRAQLTAS